MMNSRFKKLSGDHAGQSYIIVSPNSEIETPLHWILHNETNTADKLIVSEDELSDTKQWLLLSVICGTTNLTSFMAE
jgi:hypothetical protein